jgi:hypothetical protein
MQAIAAIALLALVSGCATTTPRADEECTRFTAATRAYGKVFNPMDMQKKAVEECGKGDPYACVSAPVAIPYTSLLYVAGLPLVFPVLLASDNVYRNGCPHQ